MLRPIFPFFAVSNVALTNRNVRIIRIHPRYFQLLDQFTSEVTLIGLQQTRHRNFGEFGGRRACYWWFLPIYWLVSVLTFIYLRQFLFVLRKSQYWNVLFFDVFCCINTAEMVDLDCINCNANNYSRWRY